MKLTFPALIACLFAISHASPGAEQRPEITLPSSTETMHLRLPVESGTGTERSAGLMDLVELGVADTRLRTRRVPAIGPEGLPITNRFEWAVTVPPRTNASSTRRFRLESPDAQGSVSSFRFAGVDPQSLGLYERNQPVFVYRHGVIRRDGVPADRARSTYLHPLYGLDGEVLTDDFPADHHHHRGLFWAWPHVGVGGKNYDLWALSGVEQRFERWLHRPEISVAAAVLGVENGWYVGEHKIMTERLWFTVHPATDTHRAIDLDAYWIPTTEPVSLAGAEGKSYGGLTLRYAPRQNTVITTPLGNGTNDLYITRLPWADLSAQFEGAPQASGAALFIAPDHPDYPPTWLTRHYGVLCLGWPGVEARTFEPGVPVRCRYRTWIHRGNVTPTQLAAAYASYTNGLTADWTQPDSGQPRLKAQLERDHVRVLVDGRLFTDYLYSKDSKLPHFHPLVGPRSGHSITVKEATPYPHHASLWFGCDRVNGGNFWQEGLDRGRIRSEKVRILDDGTTSGTVVIEQGCLWERPGADAPFSDLRTIRITAPSATRRVIDFDILLTALTDVRVEKSNHSLFAARMAPDLAVTSGGRLINAAGDAGEKATFGKTAAWMDARGSRVGDIVEGLTLYPHPNNPDHPVPWFTRDYGFLSPTSLNWLEDGEIRFEKGETIRLQYRVILHADNPPNEELDRLGFAPSP
jgi:hypothetical protein